MEHFVAFLALFYDYVTMTYDYVSTIQGLAVTACLTHMNEYLLDAFIHLYLSKPASAGWISATAIAACNIL